MPDIDDVKRGVIASKIAAHAADIVNNVPGARELDRKISVARKNLDWETQVSMSLDPEKVKKVHSKYTTKGRACSMCGKYCAMELMEKYLGITASKC